MNYLQAIISKNVAICMLRVEKLGVWYFTVNPMTLTNGMAGEPCRTVMASSLTLVWDNISVSGLSFLIKMIEKDEKKNSRQSTAGKVESRKSKRATDNNNLK